VIEPLSDGFRTAKVMILLEQLMAPLQLIGLEYSNLQAVQERLILGAGLSKFCVHAAKPEKSAEPCPAKRFYRLTFNGLSAVKNLPCVYLSKPEFWVRAKADRSEDRVMR